MGLAAYILSYRQKSEWHTSAPVRIFRYGNQISLFSPSTGLSKHKHAHTLTCTQTYTLLHPQCNNPNKKPFLIKATGLNTRSILLSPMQPLYANSNSLFSLRRSSCPVVSEALCEAYCGCLSGSAQIASASYSEIEEGEQEEEGGAMDREGCHEQCFWISEVQ